jgi:TPP-dependent pyruvate/acetoin dehydrogenase alpha subunit
MTAKSNDLNARKQTAFTTKKIIAAALSKLPAGSNGFSLISNEKLLSLYAVMLQCRMIEERMRTLFPQSKALSLGREASAVGVTIDLLPQDALVPSYCDLTPAFAKGVPLEQIVSHLKARALHPAATGKSKITAPPTGTTPAHFTYEPLSVHASSSAIATQLNIAAGLALANKLQDNGKIVVVFSSIEAGVLPVSWLGPWLEALKSAGEQSLPILFVSQNHLSGEAAGHRRSVASGRNALDTQAYGFPTIPVDGSDVVAVYRVASESISRIRQGRGPTLIDCQSFNVPTQSTSSRTGKRPTDDAIVGIEEYLTRKGLFSQELKEQIVAAFGKEIDAALAGYSSRRK